jgi:hypothetical protein
LALSPDGKRVAADKRDPQSGNLDIWLPDVVPDGKRFLIDSQGERGRVRADHGGAPLDCRAQEVMG